jgi:hypothetical protein
LDTVKGYSFSTPMVEGYCFSTPAVKGYCLSTPAVAGRDFAVNGPNDKRLEWEAINWRVHEANVVRLRRRIFTATREQDWAAVRSLQKLMLRSWSNTLISVRQVTQRNTGRRTAGIDGQVALSSQARMDMAVRVHDTICSWAPLPVRRVYIVRREALCCIPNTVGRNLEDRFWVQWLT